MEDTKSASPMTSCEPRCNCGDPPESQPKQQSEESGNGEDRAGAGEEGEGSEDGEDLGLVSFNHITREVKNLELSTSFYCSLLGFRRIARPELGVDGVWVYHDHAAISVHLLQGNPPQRPWRDSDGPLENRDHVNFLTKDIHRVERLLRKKQVFFHKVTRDSIGIVQIFLADPDGNVIEIGSCAPPPDYVTCQKQEKQQTNNHNLNNPVNGDRRD